MAADPRQDAERISVLMNSGEYARAVKAAARARKRFPNEAYFANAQGLAHVQAGQPLDAARAFRVATRLRPADFGFQKNYCQALISAGLTKEALDRIRQLQTSHPNEASLHVLTALTHRQVGAYDNAAQAIREAVKAAPKDPVAARLLADNLTDQGHFRDALAAYDHALSLDPGAVDTLLAKTVTLTRLDRGEDALEVTRRCLELAPTHHGALLRHAVLLNEAGLRDEAKDAALRLMELQPDNPDAIALIVQLQSAEENRALRPRLEAIMKPMPLGHPAWPHIALAVASIDDKAGDTVSAGQLMKRANQVFAGQRRYDMRAAQAEFERICALFPPGVEPPPAPETDGPYPIFIIGLPRSGTTLTERVISAHPKVFSGGELPQGPAIGERLMGPGAVLEVGVVVEATRQYRAGLPAAADDHAALTDKMYANYRYLGLLVAAFPNARVVSLIRDPRDTALSMWRSYFPSRRLDFAFDLKAMADEANRFRRYLAHWHRVFPGRIYDLSYETLVGDVETASRQLAAFCGLDWRPEMAAPEKNRAAIRTASVIQARSKVTQSSVGGWRRYAEDLAPFTSALDPALWPSLETPGPDGSG